MALKFGLALMNDFPPHVAAASRIGQLREQVRAARDAGIRSVWVLNHYLGNMPTLQPLPTLAALAEHSGDMALGTNMYILPLRHPVGVAEEFATLDHISNGHAIAGFGMGYRGNEFESFGVPMEERVSRYEESVTLIRELWENKPVTFEGRHFALRDQKIGLPPVRQGGPPIWIGAGVHKSGARRAARLGDAWIVPPHAGPDELRSILEFYRAERERVGRGDAQEIVVRRECVLDEDPDRARQIGLRARAETTAMYAQFDAPDQTDSYRHLKGADGLADVADQSYLFTTPERCVAALKELEAIGISYVILRMQWYALEHERMLQTLDAFKSQVLPHFR